MARDRDLPLVEVELAPPPAPLPQDSHTVVAVDPGRPQSPLPIAVPFVPEFGIAVTEG